MSRYAFLRQMDEAHKAARGSSMGEDAGPVCALPHVTHSYFASEDGTRQIRTRLSMERHPEFVFKPDQENVVSVRPTNLLGGDSRPALIGGYFLLKVAVCLWAVAWLWELLKVIEFS